MKKNPSIANRARTRCESWRTYFSKNIEQYHFMLNFVLSQQWTEDEEQEMIKTFKKYPLTANKLATMANTLLGEQQQNTPQLQVVPLSTCDEQVAEIRELIVKDIVLSQTSKDAYQVAAMQACLGGFSAYMWDTEYVHHDSFDLDIVCRSFKDATRVFFDKSAELIDKTDGQFCGFISHMTPEKFKSLFGVSAFDKVFEFSNPNMTEVEVAAAVDTTGMGFNWIDNNYITIIDYFERKYHNVTLYKMSNGRVLNQDELDEMIESSQAIVMQQIEQPQNPEMGAMGQMGEDGMENMQPPQPQMPQGEQGEQGEDEELITLFDNGKSVRIEDKRTVKRARIKRYKIAGEYVLEETEFPSESLPIVFVDNNSYYDKSGSQMCRSFFGDCTDTQRYINYLRTQSAYILKVSRYDQWIGSKKNVASGSTQEQWRNPQSFQGMLTYDESPTGMKPEQIRPPELSQSLYQQYQLAIEDLYTSTGLYPTRLGAQGSEVSGAAIDARTRQGSYPTYVFFNSINRAIAAGGKVVNEMIPRVYDTQRVLTLMTPDRGLQPVTINQPEDNYGSRIKNDMTRGTYQVRLLPGASFEGQKQEALTSLREIIQVDPQAFNLIADLYAENLPLANTIEIKNRLKTLVPPEIVQAGKSGEMPPKNNQPNPEEQAQQLQAQLKQAELKLKEQELQIKQQEIITDAQMKLRELENDRLESAAELKESELRYMAETQRTQSDINIAHADNLVKLLTSGGANHGRKQEQ